MFQFTRFPLPVLCVQTGVTPHDGCRVSPFRHPRINAWSAAPRGLSQPPTSFFGSRRQGIHRWLFVAWKNKDARARYAILKGRSGNTAMPQREAGASRALPQNGIENDELSAGRPRRSTSTTGPAASRTNSQCINWELPLVRGTCTP